MPKKREKYEAEERERCIFSTESGETVSSRRNINVPSLPLFSVGLVIAILLILFGTIYWLDSSLPEPLILDNQYNDKQFVAGRAIHTLDQLSKIGIKLVGSHENEVLAVAFLKREIFDIIQKANPVHQIKYDLQKTTGYYSMSFLNYYNTVQNVVVKLSSANSNDSNPSLLINCHFDSAISSPGASDDGINCAVMLEVLRVLSKESEPFLNDIVFLFNGAEESQLQASHGFITQHKWAKSIKAFINLEACGSGGKEILFQTSAETSWPLLMYSSSVPHPHGVVIGEEIFQSGIIPSDTDFRIFRDFGKIPGLDFAHHDNGYVYHTQFDDISRIQKGSYQHTGDNMLAMIRHIAMSPELVYCDSWALGKSVYYDFPAVGMIVISEFVSNIANYITVFLSLTIFFLNMRRLGGGIIKNLIIGCGTLVVGWIIGFVFSIIIAFILDASFSTMSWFNKPYLVVGIYYIPTLIGCMLLPVLLHKWTYRQTQFNTGLQAILYCNTTQFVFTMILLFGTILKIRSVFILQLFVLFPTIASIVLYATKRHRPVLEWLGIYQMSLILPLLYLFYLSMLSFGLFIPITGRIGPDKNPELIIGSFSVLLCILSTSYLAPLIILIRKPWRVLAVLGSVNILCLIVIIFTSFGFPYNGSFETPTPQRIMVLHTEREFYDKNGLLRKNDFGYWLISLDRNNPKILKGIVPEIDNAMLMKKDCEEEVFCGFPLFTARLRDICKFTYWIPADKINTHNPELVLQLVSQRMVLTDVRRLTFNVSGSDHMDVFISPKMGVSLQNWSFGHENMFNSSSIWNERLVYYVHYVSGLNGPTWSFWLDLKVPKDVTSVLDITVTSHYFQDYKSYKTAQFNEFIHNFPNWTAVMPWVASVKSWTY